MATMGAKNQLSRYGAISKVTPMITGKAFFLLNANESGFGDISDRYPVDEYGVARVYTTWASLVTALQNATTGQSNVVFVSPQFTTAPTLAQISTLNGLNVTVQQAAMLLPDGSYIAQRVSSTLAQIATTNFGVFSVTGRIQILGLIGQIDTSLGSLNTNVQYLFNPTVGSGLQQMCASTNLSLAMSGTNFFLNNAPYSMPFSTTSGIAAGGLWTVGSTGNQLQVASSQNIVANVAPQSLIVPAGTINFSQNFSSNTGFVSFKIIYKAIDQGAFCFPL